MKTTLIQSSLFSFLFFISLICASQSRPPGISWKRSDRIQVYPPFVTVPLTHANQDLKEASEDWWYDHINSYDNGIVDPTKFNGFITCGYSLYTNIEFSEQNGCEIQTVPVPSVLFPFCSDELEYANFPPGRDNAHSFQTIARFDVFGNML